MSDPIVHRVEMPEFASTVSGNGKERLSQSARQIRIGNFIVDLEEHCLVCGDAQTSLDRKELVVLLQLIDAAPKLVTTKELLKANWSGVVVGDNAVHQVITRLRRAFGDDARNPKYLQTLSRRGYRLMMAPTAIQSTGSKKCIARKSLLGYWIASCLVVSLFGITLALQDPVEDVKVTSDPTVTEDAGPTAVTKTLAVLDFEDISPTGDANWLAIGLSQELRRQLSSLDGVRVLGRVVTHNPELQSLPTKVDVAISGTVQSDGARINVGIEATDLESAELIYAETLEGAGSDLLEMQRRLAANLARVFGGVLFVDAWGPKEIDAYEPFLKWLYYSAGASPEDSSFWLRETLTADPNWASGWVQQAFEKIRDAHYSPNREAIRQYLMQAQESLARAQKLSRDPNIGHWVDMMLRGYVDMNLEYVEQRSRSLGDSISYIQLMNKSGLHDEAISAFRAFLSRDPHNTVWDGLSMAYGATQDWAQAIDASRRCAHYAPPRSYNCHYAQANALPKFDLLAAEKLLAEIEETQNARRSTEVNSRMINLHLTTILKFGIAKQRGQTELARQVAQAYPETMLVNGFYLLEVGDPKAEQYLANAHPRLTDGIFWEYYVASIDEKYREHPAFIRFRNQLGFTDLWRLKLCERANLWPEEYYIACDVEKYR